MVGAAEAKKTALMGVEMFGFELKVVVLAVLIVMGAYVFLRFVNKRK